MINWSAIYKTMHQKTDICVMDLFEKPPEREIELSLSWDCLNTFLSNHGLEYQLVQYGDDRFPIYKAYIFDHQRGTKWIGGGKGFKQQGSISALAECLQHYIAFNAVLNYDDTQTQLLSGSEFLSSPLINKFNKYTQIFEDADEINFLTLPYNDINNPANILHYPLTLTEPYYNKICKTPKSEELSLLWRSHDTGSTLGSSYNDALLHGINEWIEKHSLSLFFSSSFFSKNSTHTIKYIDKNRLPVHIYEFIQYIEKKFNDDLSIILLNNDFNIPCILSLFNHQKDCMIQPKGFSCSLNRQYAIEKSIFEALQCRLLRNSNAETREQQIIDNFTPYPLFLHACKMAISSKRKCMVDYQDLPLYDETLSVSDQITTIAKLLENNGGYKIYNHIYKCEPNGLASLQVLIPGFNESCLIKEGKFILK